MGFGKLLKIIILNTLREKWPNTKFFLVRIFLHSDWIRRDTPYLSVFSPNVGKYEPQKTPYLDTFHAVITPNNVSFWKISSIQYITIAMKP